MVNQLPINQRFATAATVQWSNEWGAAWQTLPADRVKISYTLGQAIGRASFLLRAGALRQIFATGSGSNQDAFQIDSYGFTALANTWVKITGATQDASTVLWYGRILDATETLDGGNNEDLEVECYDLRWMLTRKQVVTSFAYGDDGGDPVTVTPAAIARALPFNEVRSGVIWGNMSGNGEYFAEDVTDREEWTAAAAIRYLLANFRPDEELTWTLAANTATDVLEAMPVLVQQTHGKTVYQLLNELMPRNRGLSWRLDFNEGTSTATIVPVSMTQTAVTLPGSSTVIPASTDQQALNLEDNRDIAPRLTYSAQNRYDAIKVEGARKLAVGTFKVAQIAGNNSELANNWDSTSRAAYISGAGTVTPAVDKTPLDEQARRTAPLSYVFSTFNLPTDWDGRCKGDAIMFAKHNATTGLPLSSFADTWIPGLRFESRLPLLEAYNYSDPSAPALVSGFTAQNNQYMEPIATIEYDGKRYDVTNLPRTNEKQVLPFTCSVQVFDNQPTVYVRTSSPPHVLGGDEFNNSTDKPGDYEQVLDYLDLEFTLAMQMDEHISYTYPETPTATNDMLQTQVIRIGDRAQWIYVADGTTVGVSKTGTLTTATGDLIRNDMELLKDIAREAYVWYGTERRALDVSVQQIIQYVQPGTLITTIDAVATTLTVNTTVSFVEYDFSNGTQRISTAFAEIDFGVA